MDNHGEIFTFCGALDSEMHETIAIAARTGDYINIFGFYFFVIGFQVSVAEFSHRTIQVQLLRKEEARK